MTPTREALGKMADLAIRIRATLHTPAADDLTAEQWQDIDAALLGLETIIGHVLRDQPMENREQAREHPEV